MRYKKLKSFMLVLLIIYVFSIISQSVGCVFAYNENVEKSYTDSYYCSENEDNGVKISSRFMELFLARKKTDTKVLLIASGSAFGLTIYEPYVTVNEAAEPSALKRGDKIISIDGTEIKSAEDVKSAMKYCLGKPVKITLLRGGEELSVIVTPKEEGGEYKLGITLKRPSSGIGTLTYIDPVTGAFGGLGHGVCDGESGKLCEIETGDVCNVILGGIKRGEIGKPGELSGILTKRSFGKIEKNTECGIFGTLTEYSTEGLTAIEVGTREEIHTGSAEIISTAKNGSTTRYKIEITEIDHSSTNSKSFKIKVVDKALIALTGGIVRGMSGSPIIQDGKLVGAVTHVLVANPTEGYGIFIENMLNAAQSQATPKAA